MQSQEKKLGFKEQLDLGKEYYEVRLESIGGLGANLLGKMLGELGLKYLNVNSSSFSSYGSEKTGTPVKGFVRYCKKEKEIRVHSPIMEPDLLVIFHQALLRDASVWKGCSSKTKVIVALEQGQEMPGRKVLQEYRLQLENNKNDNDMQEDERYPVMYGLEAQKIAMETHSRINVVLLGAILKIMGVENPEAGEQICTDTLGKKYPASLQGNLEGMHRGYQEVKELTKDIAISDSKEKSMPIIKEKADNQDKEKTRTFYDKQTEWGYLNAPIGGINPHLGNSVISDLSPSRQGYIPLFIKEKCINCGLCFSACPDMVFQFVKGEYKGRKMMINQGLDYYHCKGCLRCVDVCPVNALVTGLEAEHERKEHFMPNQELLRLPRYYEKAGADGYITSESYLTEERIEGGEV